MLGCRFFAAFAKSVYADFILTVNKKKCAASYKGRSCFIDCAFGRGQLDRSVTRRSLALCRAGTPGQRRYGDMEQHPEEGP